MQNQNAVELPRGWETQTMGYVESVKNIANSTTLKNNKYREHGTTNAK